MSVFELFSLYFPSLVWVARRNTFSLIKNVMIAEEKVVSKDFSLLRDCILGAAASSAATLVSNPIEVCKTRLQLQGELQTRAVETRTAMYSGMRDCFSKIARSEGIRGLQGGLLAGIAYQAVMNGFRLGVYDQINKHRGSDPSDPLFFVKNAFTAGVVGAVSSVVGNPFFLVKVRLQTANKSAVGSAQTRAIGHQFHYRGIIHGLKSIYKEAGFKGFFQGVSAAAARLAIGSAAQFGFYDSNKHILGSGTLGFQLQGTTLHIVSSAISAFAVACAMNPMDVVSTRIYNQAKGESKYKGAFDCLVKIFRSEGLHGLYKGLWPHYARLAPHSIITFAVFEQLKKLSRDLNLD